MASMLKVKTPKATVHNIGVRTVTLPVAKSATLAVAWASKYVLMIPLRLLVAMELIVVNKNNVLSVRQPIPIAQRKGLLYFFIFVYIAFIGLM